MNIFSFSKLFASFGLVALMAFPAFASDLKFSETIVDVGEHKEGPVFSKEITITNVGSELVVIKNLSTS